MFHQKSTSKIDGQGEENGIVLDCGEDNESKQDEEEPHLIEVSDWTTNHRKICIKIIQWYAHFIAFETRY